MWPTDRVRLLHEPVTILPGLFERHVVLVWRRPVRSDLCERVPHGACDGTSKDIEVRASCLEVLLRLGKQVSSRLRAEVTPGQKEVEEIRTTRHCRLGRVGLV